MFKNEDKKPAQSQSQPVPAQTVTEQDLVPAPPNVDVEGWREAERAVRGRVGGYAGVPKAQRYTLVWEAYNQLVETNKQAAKWEGK